jgi:hypothetical protein
MQNQRSFSDSAVHSAFKIRKIRAKRAPQIPAIMAIMAIPAGGGAAI